MYETDLFYRFHKYTLAKVLNFDKGDENIKPLTDVGGFFYEQKLHALFSSYVFCMFVTSSN
ncbi:hypothetical protein HNP24_004131 [Chryseobacterium sediminis]|uniref:Uncharacterized protein n=1 Tax=Chryseobacterium sediminis TaxID=1679494 RepID=A0ABR6Q625_9FLAO|nr:hypothetical protein [Chryseobacterium sediminis]